MEVIKLSKETIAKLRTQQRELHDVIPELDKAEKCGIDCSAWRDLHTQASDQIVNLLTEYGK